MLVHLVAAACFLFRNITVNKNVLSASPQRLILGHINVLQMDINIPKNQNTSLDMPYDVPMAT